MKRLKVLPLVFIVPISLTACSKDPYLGNYVFQLGKSKDTHMGITLSLTDEFFDETNHDLGHKYVLSVDLSSSTNKETSSSTEESDTDFMSLLSEMDSITGYYSINENEKIYDETRLNLAITVLGEYAIPQELTDLIFVANINSSTVNFYLPVSLDDLYFQLYWYGYDVLMDIDAEDYSMDSKDGEHPVGTHPTKEDIDKINEHYSKNHKNADGQPITYRDYHVLKLGLTKQ